MSETAGGHATTVAGDSIPGKTGSFFLPPLWVYLRSTLLSCCPCISLLFDYLVMHTIHPLSCLGAATAVRGTALQRNTRISFVPCSVRTKYSSGLFIPVLGLRMQPPGYDAAEASTTLLAGSAAGWHRHSGSQWFSTYTTTSPS